MLSGENIYLRALEPTDLEFLYAAENDASLWHVGVLQQPISKFTLKAYLEQAHQTLPEAGQLRMMICLNNDQPIGLIDLFDFDPLNMRVGAGILLLESNRGKGLGAEALHLIKQYAKEKLGIHQIYAHVQVENMPSLGLFKKCGFSVSGTLVDWVRADKTFSDVYLMQCIL
jgi:diamine N-acetyltransferase